MKCILLIMILLVGCSNTPSESIPKFVPTKVPTATFTAEPTATPVPTTVPTATSTLRKDTIESETPESSACTLAGGEVVQSEWSGNDTGPNYCNSCQCINGFLTCTEMACMPVLSPTVLPPQ